MEEHDSNAEDGSDDTAAESKAVHMCDSLDMALAWCEDCIIHANATKLEKALAAEEQSLSNIIASVSGHGTDGASRLTKISSTYLNLFTSSSALNLFAGGGSASEPDNVSSTSDKDATTDSVAMKTALNKSQSPSSKTIGIGAKIASSKKSKKTSFLVTTGTVPPHMLQLLALCPDEPLKVEKLGEWTCVGWVLALHSFFQLSIHPRLFSPLIDLCPLVFSYRNYPFLLLHSLLTYHHHESNPLSCVPCCHAVVGII